MTWLQQVIFLALGLCLFRGNVQAGECNNVAHVPDGDVQHRAEGADLKPGVSVDIRQLDVPVVVDVLRRPGRSGNTMGETLVGIATTDGQSVTFQGPAVNEAQPVTLGPDCRPLEPGEVAPRGGQTGREAAPRR